MSQPFWLDTEEGFSAWDALWLGDEFIPGLPTITIQKTRSVDVQKTKGQDGSFLADNGYDPAKVSISVRIWTRAQWEQWLEVLPNIDPQRPGGLRTPLSILNPVPNGMGIDTVYVTSISMGSPEGSMLTVSIECIQWFPEPKPAKSGTTPKEKNSDQFGPPPPPVPGQIL